MVAILKNPNLTPNMSDEERMRLDRLLWLYRMGMHETLALIGEGDIKNIWHVVNQGFFIYGT